MGTSVSQPSPRVPNWNRVFACYKNAHIPESRFIKELWSASENQDNSISMYMKSSTVFACYEAISKSNNYEEAQTKINTLMMDKGTNSIVIELGKRVIPLSYHSQEPSKEWRQLFFSEVSKYLISRDASGFVGKGFRNKSVKELINFKEKISSCVKAVASKYDADTNTHKEWIKFIDNTIKSLKE